MTVSMSTGRPSASGPFLLPAAMMWTAGPCPVCHDGSTLLWLKWTLSSSPSLVFCHNNKWLRRLNKSSKGDIKRDRRDCTLCHCTVGFFFSLRWRFQIFSLWSLPLSGRFMLLGSHVLTDFSVQRGVQSKIMWILPFRETPMSQYLGEGLTLTTESLSPGSDSHETPRSFSYLFRKLLSHPSSPSPTPSVFQGKENHLAS